MKVILNNNVGYIPDSGLQGRVFVSQYMTSFERVRRPTYFGGRVKSNWVRESRALYKFITDSDRGYLFPRGLFDLVPQEIKSQIDIVDQTNYILDVGRPEYDGIKSILQPQSGFDLRDDQIRAALKALIQKRGIIQLPTGSGKTEVMAAVIKHLVKTNPDIKILVIEPTDILTRKTSERFSQYDVDSVTYKESRKIDKSIRHTVTVAHVASLLNDLKEDNDLLKEVRGVFWDEVHHLSCDTWLDLNFSLVNVEYAIGVSALVIPEKDLFVTDIKNLEFDGALVLGATGPVLIHVPPKFYIDKGILATPVVLQIDNKLTSVTQNESDWHKLRKLGINDPSRSELTARVSKMFIDHGRKVLVLVGTKNQAYDLSENLLKLSSDLNAVIGISFGSGVSYLIGKDNVRYVTDEDVVSKFDDGELSILYSTNHLDEGVDLSNLDVCVLASGGKKDRRIIQRIGRALRVTKTGRYAYVVDFTDTGNGVLEYHSRLRMKMYENLIEVPSDLIYKGIDIEDLESTFMRLESID